MKLKRSVLSWFIVALSLVGMLLAALLYVALRPAQGRYEFDRVFFVPLTAGALTLVVLFATKRKTTYRVSQILRIVFYLLTLPYSAGTVSLAALLLCGILLEICFFEPHPMNMVISLSLTTASLVLGGLILYLWKRPVAEILVGQAALAVCGYAVSILGSRLIRFRELFIALQRENARMENSVVQLTRANSAYQDYAIAAGESATDEERKRITRDIHDIVGYTLTNNIMLMEAALDMMQENPLGLPATIETARRNAEEGLERIRQAMYDLRRQETAYPMGMQSIHRLASLFEKTTGIQVRCEFGNVPWTISEKIDSAFYHMVQESLINSFRHGRADEIRVLFWQEGGVISLSVRDNGRGAGQVTDGIGLKGMRERIEQQGGTFRATPVTDGFLVEARVPAGGT